MQCPRCLKADTRVVDSRLDKSSTIVKRRRQCRECNYRFSTLEEIIRENFYVKKRNGQREPFDRNKILRGLQRACEKRPIDPEQIKMLVADVITELERNYEEEVPSRIIGEVLMKRLKRTDQIAYVRYASVYKEFRDIAELEAEIALLKKHRY